MLISKTKDALCDFVRAARRNKLERMLAARFQEKRKHFLQAETNPPVVTLEAPPDPAYYAILGEIMCGLRQRCAITADQIDTQSLRPGASRSVLSFLRARMSFNKITQRKWEKLYGVFCDSQGYRATSWCAPHRAMRLWLLAWQVWRALENKEMLSALTYRGICYGDLVIDTYLRLGPHVFVNLRAPYLLVTIRQALKNIDHAFKYFQHRKPVAFLTMYASYLQHGIPVRVAVACGVRTMMFGNLQEFATPASPSHMFHTKPSNDYDRDFSALLEPAEKLKAAANALELRLSGKIDPATAYMKRSAYDVITLEVPNVSGAAVIFLHDFYDSLHIYPWTLFHDFWDWVCTTIDALEDADQDYWIKPHPNQKAASSAEIAALRIKYPGAKFVPPEITNRQLADAGMACVITLYGSVAPEAGFMGIPSISSGASPHSSFRAFGLAHSREEYRDMLAAIAKPTLDKDRLKDQACAFYYMHNLNLQPDAMAARDRFAVAWTLLLGLEPGGYVDEAEVSNVLTNLTENLGFARFCEALITSNQT